jgi:addiction module RelB/DinJ family antitoxin
MGAVNVTIRVDEDTKKEFDDFCDNVGMNVTTAINMFIRATLRTRELPFVVTDAEPHKSQDDMAARKAFKMAFEDAQRQAAVNGTSEMTLDEINAIIVGARQAK